MRQKSEESQEGATLICRGPAPLHVEDGNPQMVAMRSSESYIGCPKDPHMSPHGIYEAEVGPRKKDRKEECTRRRDSTEFRQPHF